MKKTVWLASAAILAGVIVSPAFADSWGGGGHKQHGGWGGEGRHGGRMMQIIDANADGVVGDDEAAAMAERLFNRLDQDGNGELTLEEATTPMRGKNGMGHGKRHDGWKSWWSGNNQQAEQQPQGPAASQQADGATAGASEKQLPPRFAQMQERLKARFAEADADKNNVVTKGEFMTAAKARFMAADADKDGKVTPWEFRSQQL